MLRNFKLSHYAVNTPPSPLNRGENKEVPSIKRGFRGVFSHIQVFLNVVAEGLIKCIGNSKLIETVTEDTFHDGIGVKVFDFWFYFMEKIGFSTVISIIYWDNKANMTHIALFFDRTDSISGVFGLK